MDVFSEIKELIARQCAVDEAEVVAQAHLQDNLGADSMGLMILAEAISRQYGIEILIDDLVDIENVGELVKLVEARVSSK
jgi:acyl carrier protein